MILVADCGGTKADWAWLRAGQAGQIVHTSGFNPLVQEADDLRQMLDQLSTDLLPDIRPTHIHYYGAGVWSAPQKKQIAKALQRVWPMAQPQVTHDLLGAARAGCGRKAGIACILGTGSNSCLYDGQQVIDHVSNLGYLVGDEGSGCDIGKELLRAYFYRELDPALRDQFENFAQLDMASVRQGIYNSASPNAYLAGFTRFLGQHPGHPQVIELVSKCFGRFLDRHILKYEGCHRLPVSFVGSIAFHFRPMLLKVMEDRNLLPGKFVPKPIQALAEYHHSEI